MVKSKYYVVWKGIKPGIYTSWKECELQIKGFAGASYKSFKTLALAEKALKGDSRDFVGKEIFESELSDTQLKLIGKPITNSISVDAACNAQTGEMEYQGVKTNSKEVIFKMGPFKDGTNNVGEFLAIVHGLAYLKKNNINIPLYSDSRNAIAWVKNKEHRSNLTKSSENEKIFELLNRAEKWLKNNSYENKILKWETKAWGENPADFGRK